PPAGAASPRSRGGVSSPCSAPTSPAGGGTMLHPDTPDARAYVHRACGGSTVISGDDFEQLSDPFRMITGTFCARCGRMVGLREVFWVDTGEAVARPGTGGGRTPPRRCGG